MPAQLTAETQIENPRNYSEATVLTLRDLLNSGPTIVPDPKRRGFCEVHGDTHIYYIHISPVTGNILLLAKWPSEAPQRNADRTA